MRSDTGLHDLKHLQKGIVEHVMHVTEALDGGWFHSCLASGMGWGE